MPRPILNGLDHFLCMSMLATLDLGFAMLLCPSWTCAFVVTSIPPRVCLDVTTCEIHLHGVGVLGTFLCSVRCWFACFAPPIWLSLLFCIFAHLPTCSCMSLCVVHTPIQWNYGHSIQTYVCPPPRTPPFVWQYVSLSFHVLHMFIYPRLASFPCLSLVCFSFCFFLCLSISLFLLSLHVHAWSKDAWKKGVI